MKMLINSLKKTKLSVRITYYFVLLISIFSYFFLLKELIDLNGIETQIRILALCILGFILFIYIFGNLVLLLKKKYKIVYLTSFIIMFIAAVSINGGLALNKFNSSIENMNKESLVYTTNLITLKDTKYSNSKDIKIGIINNEEDPEGYILPKEYINKEKLKNEIIEVDDTFILLEKLYNKELDAIFITSNYVIMYEGYEQYANIQTDVKVEKTYSKEMDNIDFVESTATVDKPFTILLMGVDSTGEVLNANAAFNGDTLMLITFNPHTLNATVFSIPRDTYVPIACLKGESSKINSSAAYGTKCVIDTVQNLTGINIDYYVKINFKGVVDLVDALKGIDITVPDKIDFCEQNSKRSFEPQDLLCIKSGYQHMNGEQALAFARHRHTLPQGDFQRVQHQQLVVEAIANSAKNLSSIEDFTKVLDAVSINMDTNMSTKEIKNLYNVFKNIISNSNNGSMINIQKTYLTGYDLTMYVNNLRSNVYTFQYYEQSLNEIVKALKVTLELEKSEQIKTFNFSVNDTYEIPIIGKKYYTVQRNETLPNFVNQNLDYVKTWCQERNITVNVNYISDTTKTNNTVTYQSVNKGVLTNTITQITVNVVQNETVSQITEMPETNTNDDVSNETNDSIQETAILE